MYFMESIFHSQKCYSQVSLWSIIGARSIDPLVYYDLNNKKTKFGSGMKVYERIISNRQKYIVRIINITVIQQIFNF